MTESQNRSDLAALQQKVEALERWRYKVTVWIVVGAAVLATFGVMGWFSIGPKATDVAARVAEIRAGEVAESKAMQVAEKWVEERGFVTLKIAAENAAENATKAAVRAEIQQTRATTAAESAQVELERLGQTVRPIAELQQRVAELEAAGATVARGSQSPGYFRTGLGPWKPMPLTSDGSPRGPAKVVFGPRGVTLTLAKRSIVILSSSGVSRVMDTSRDTIHFGFIFTDRRARLTRDVLYRSRSWRDAGGWAPFSLTTARALNAGEYHIGLGSTEQNDGDWEFHNVNVQVVIIPQR